MQKALISRACRDIDGSRVIWGFFIRRWRDA
jgi:hypothetical protein